MNEHFFDNIYTESKAYLLGFYVADGNIFKYKTQQIRMKITVTKKDIEIVEYFKKHLYPNANITFGKSRILKVLNKTYVCKETANFYISSDILTTPLINMGYGFKKTNLPIRLPNINDDLRRHFIRGYFDGDGSISYTIGIRKQGKNKGNQYFNHYCNFVSSTDFILKDILNFSSKYNINFKLRPHKKKYYLIDITSITDLVYFYDFLYKDSTLCLTRKKEKFEKIIELRKKYIREHRVPNRLKKLFGM